MEASVDPSRIATEFARHRETFRYAPNFVASAVVNPNGRPLQNKGLKAADDIVLTALAQLGACRTSTDHSLVSLFDKDYQYIVAEATPTLPLVPGIEHDALHFCGTATPRKHGRVCEHALLERGPSDQVTVIPDLSADPRFQQDPLSEPGSPVRFHASVPIKSPKGISIGVYCVTRDVADGTWTEQDAQVMRNISHAITRHLEAGRSTTAHRRSERMTRGIGSFVEDKATMSGWQEGPYAAACEDDTSREGALNADQQNLQQDLDVDHFRSPPTASSGDPGNEPKSGSETNPPTSDGRLPNPNPPPEPTNLGSDISGRILEKSGDAPRRDSADLVFSRAANIIREALEVEGVVFLDAATTTYGALGKYVHEDVMGKPNWSTQSATSSSGSGSEAEDSALPSGNQRPWPPARVLSFSTSTGSSIDGHRGEAQHTNVADSFLGSLLRRYPKGKVFTFDAEGQSQPSDESDEERLGEMSPLDRKVGLEEATMPARQRHQRKLRVRRKEREGLLQMFPRARCVAFLPVWDPRKNRWYAGGFAYTEKPTRLFSVEGELSYLRGFGSLAMAETLRRKTMLDDKSKWDALSSLSHELRSPLHGIILASELMGGTELTVMQGDILHTMETCGRTLTDTVEHLLDYSKINHLTTSTKGDRRLSGGRGLRQSPGVNAAEAGMTNLVSVVRLDLVAEQVIECVFAGFNFQRKSIAQLDNQDRDRAVDPDAAANQLMDGLRAGDDSARGGVTAESAQPFFDDVMIFFVADPTCAWHFETQPGAIRRIVMNLFANALKYTRRGVIKVTMDQKASPDATHYWERLVSISVSDTGCGMSEDFLQNELFKPFAQEDHLAPGTGLGLSLVQRVVSQLGGRVSAQSSVDSGTTVKVTLPLSMPPLSADGPPPSVDDAFVRQQNELHGLRIRIIGFDKYRAHIDGALSESGDLIGSICSNWLHLDVIPAEGDDRRLVPDLVLSDEDALSLRKSDEALAKPPCVVVCANTLVAHRHSSATRSSKQAGFVEFISQPVGPHKLAKMLLLVFQRWTSAQEAWSTSGADGTEYRSSSVVSSTPECPSTPETPASPKQAAPKGRTESTDPPTVAASIPNDGHSRPIARRPKPSRSTLKKEPPVQYLLVDDSRINVKILSTYVDKLGRKYQTATDGQQAADAFKRDPGQCRCIFMDVSMPVMDGFEATRQIRTYEKERGLEPSLIIALTGLASDESQREAVACGMDLFLTKPVKLKELSAILRSRSMID